MREVTTESKLFDWRQGSIQAERLSAEVLSIEGYKDIDPQSTLGGPDGGKDIKCTKEGRSYITAVYFPPTAPKFREIKKKFQDDLKGVHKNNADGFIFVTNQKLTLSERTELIDLSKDKIVNIYHLERLRTVLDSPSGYGIRLEYLNIAMTQEDQLAFWSIYRTGLVDNLIEHKSKLNSIDTKLNELIVQTRSIMTVVGRQSSIFNVNDPSNILQPAVTFPSSNLTQEQVKWIHKLLMTNEKVNPNVIPGQYRKVIAWIGSGSLQEAKFVPIPPEQIETSMEFLLRGWRDNYLGLLDMSKDIKIMSIAHFHYELVAIHPFLDGNGRVARALLIQQAQELLNADVRQIFSSNVKGYYESLSKANQGNIEELAKLINASLE